MSCYVYRVIVIVHKDEHVYVAYVVMGMRSAATQSTCARIICLVDGGGDGGKREQIVSYSLTGTHKPHGPAD